MIDMDGWSNADAAEIGESLDRSDDDENRKLVSEGTKLLQSALSKKSSNLNEPKSRMPLSDIKNVVRLDFLNLDCFQILNIFT